MTPIIITLLFLLLALSLDTLATGFAYGTEKIKLPFSSATVISIICAIFFGGSVLLGGVLSPFLSDSFTKYACFFILLIIALSKLFESAFKAFLRKLKLNSKNIKIKAFDMTFFLCVCTDCRAADRDRSRVLSVKEAVSLAVALSLDGAAAGLGSGISASYWWLAMLLAFVVSFLVLYLGSFLGKRAVSLFEFDISWIGGVILLLLAISHLF